MPMLNKVNAVLTSKKPDAEKAVGEIYKTVQKEALFQGRTRNYRPYDEEKGQKLPPENQKVQQKVTDLIGQISRIWEEIWSLTLTQDAGNMTAKADIVVDGKTIMAGVPVTNLLYLDKQVENMVTFVKSLPTPDPSENWTPDASQGLLRSEATTSLKTNKEPTVIVKYAATAQHPAQTELFTKDIAIGEWTQTQFSGAIQADQKKAFLSNATKLLAAIKEAREQANTADVQRQSTAPLFKFVFGDAVLDR